jgi:hypothetical protein
MARIEVHGGGGRPRGWPMYVTVVEGPEGEGGDEQKGSEGPADE